MVVTAQNNEAAIAGVMVEITNEAAGISAEGETDSTGRAEFLLLQDIIYTQILSSDYPTGTFVLPEFNATATYTYNVCTFTVTNEVPTPIEGALIHLHEDVALVASKLSAATTGKADFLLRHTVTYTYAVYKNTYTPGVDDHTFTAFGDDKTVVLVAAE